MTRNSPWSREREASTEGERRRASSRYSAVERSDMLGEVGWYRENSSRPDKGDGGFFYWVTKTERKENR